jgi:hypothetical protein
MRRKERDRDVLLLFSIYEKYILSGRRTEAERDWRQNREKEGHVVGINILQGKSNISR